MDGQTNKKSAILGIILFLIFIGCLIGLLTLVLYFDSQIIYIIAVLYLSFLSVKAIDSTNQDEVQECLMYWAVFAFFTITSCILRFTLNLIPAYFIIQFLFLIWLFFPNFKGALWVNEKILANIFRKLDDSNPVEYVTEVQNY